MRLFWPSIDDLPLPAPLRVWVVRPAWRAIKRLSAPEIRIVTGGIAFYALLSVFPLVYLTLTLLFALLPADLSNTLANTIDQVLVSAVAPLSQTDLETIREATPQGLTFRALIAVLFVLYTATSGAKAAITGLRMVTGSERRSNVIRFQGVSILMTALLILTVWLLGTMQLILAFIASSEGYIAFELAADLSSMASRLWIGKFIAAFAVFYLIIGVSLHGRLSGNRAKVLGSATGAAAWVGVTWAYSIYLSFTVLDTFYGALASVILGLVWLALSVSSLLLGAALSVEWAALLKERIAQTEEPEDA
ncbi:MAG: YihY/virulence factor BrkB family protein [Pseudomonadota bacterium]